MNKKIFIGLLLAVGILVACHDDTGFGPGRQPGYLYFLPTEGHSWTDGNNATRGVEAPMLMECSLDGQPIYLHTEVSPTMSPQLEESLNTMDMSADDSTATAETRGVRYTDDVFSLSSGSSTKISNFGVYATRQSDRGVIFNYKSIGPDDTDDE